MHTLTAPTKTPHGTARQRILEAAITRFADEGIAAAQIKHIAADVGVSPALVIHHFGSKDELRAACDQYLLQEIRRLKTEAMASQSSFDPLQKLREMASGPPLQRYLARTLAGGSPHVASLIDEMVQDAELYMAEGVRSGLLKPTDDLRSRVIVLTMWNLGALILHEHIQRLMGIDILDGTKGWAAWMRPSIEILTKGAIEESLYDLWRTAADTYTAETES